MVSQSAIRICWESTMYSGLGNRRKLSDDSLTQTDGSNWKEKTHQYLQRVGSWYLGVKDLWLMLKLKLQHPGHLMWRANSLERPWCWETLKAKEEGSRGWEGRMASLTQWTLSQLREFVQFRKGEPGILQSMGSQRVILNLGTRQ